MLRSAISAFTRVFDALWRCAADPGSTAPVSTWVPAVRSGVKDAAPRPGHERNVLSRRVMICPSGSFVSSPLCKNISVPTPPKSHLELFASHPTEGRWPSSRTRGGMRWTRQRFARDGIAGRIERFVSGQQHADERRLLRTAKSCGPDAPTLASSSRRQSRPYRA